MINTTLSPHPSATPGGSPKRLKRHAWLIWAIAAALGGAAVLINSSIYLATYRCQTETVDNAQQCHKYQVSPSFKDLGIVSNTACPNNPPSYCP